MATIARILIALELVVTLAACGGAPIDAPTEKPCADNTFSCSGQVIRYCDHGAYRPPVECPFVCTPDGCVGECKPDTLMVDCLGTHVCSDLGSWDPPDYNEPACEAADGGQTD